MRKQVMISIQSAESFEDRPDAEVELLTVGTLEEQQDGALRLIYDESEITGMKGTVTMFHVEPERITMMRLGEHASEMVFEEGKRYMSVRDTPLGLMEVGVQAKHLMNTLNICGGNIEVGYEVDINHMRTGTNLFRIQVQESECLPS